MHWRYGLFCCLFPQNSELNRVILVDDQVFTTHICSHWWLPDAVIWWSEAGESLAFRYLGCVKLVCIFLLLWQDWKYAYCVYLCLLFQAGLMAPRSTPPSTLPTFSQDFSLHSSDIATLLGIDLPSSSLPRWQGFVTLYALSPGLHCLSGLFLSVLSWTENFEQV